MSTRHPEEIGHRVTTHLFLAENAEYRRWAWDESLSMKPADICFACKQISQKLICGGLPPAQGLDLREKIYSQLFEFLR